ncbi:beta-ketoacyl-[acyl-carrier-protein] synthase family protein [Streptantibioticus cattleyicolor]|uniref:3-oxoacyl-(ACP) synthase II n=1 Tax=Streptantibioticus cattleyicolor (strain ATCC 35852 / DSM 46488 / JCM 4925 / NBRC 14057 / NRRL 8057) TaxID=1003195 RepID=F8JJK1_STREN|nr:beta-ketoacyl-[acyl-carrier-protein] synthase family protein [Streptantibioticus cattleyicolor]AEW98664.1 3-oxoacyl-(ACP) synthase II [Streptantibioticus cattleyicolor NRRL 8057 = DSM 46488]CCB72278.1 3-oxoacyl-[acyl-carrier-protein] synthase 2 [Streptantibioticus cattleyicolor NRRL 8057 = DSM 46488]
MTAGPAEVVVTGVGLVTPAGIGREATWEGVCAGRPTARRDPELDGLDVDFACRVPGYQPREHTPGGRPWQYDRYTQFALTAVTEAVADARLDPARWNGDRVAVVFGTAAGGTASQLEQHRTLLADGPGRVSPMLLPKYLPNMACGHIAIRLGARGPSLSTSTACASGATAIGTAWQLLRSGACDIAVAGSAEASVLPLWVAGFNRMGALSRRRADPATASRPFDVDRDGFVMGEGAGAVVLERAEDARARGCPGRAVLAGYGAATDAVHAVAPDPDGRGVTGAMRAALAAAHTPFEAVDHINAHGTGTPLNDAAEAAVIRRLFGHRPTVTSVKGALGHLLGAAGAVEAALTALTVERGIVPPVVNLRRQDPDLEINAVTGDCRKQRIDVAISNSFGFGGHNTVLVFRAR